MKTVIRSLKDIAVSEAQTVEQPEVIDAEVVDSVSEEDIIAILTEEVLEEEVTDELPEDLKHIPEPAEPIVDDEYSKYAPDDYTAYYDSLSEEERDAIENQDLPENEQHETLIGRIAESLGIAPEEIQQLDPDNMEEFFQKLEEEHPEDGDPLTDLEEEDDEEEGPDDHAREYAEQVLYHDLHDRGEEIEHASGDGVNDDTTAVQNHLNQLVEEEDLVEETVEEAFEREEEEREELEDELEELKAEKDRATLIQEINDFYTLLDMPTMGRNFELMSTQDLRDHLYLLQKNNGGSFSVATMLQNVEMQYDKYLKSDTLKLRMGLIEQKGTDFIQIAQKMRQIIGNDFVINSTRSTEYHSMLKSAVAFISVLHEKIATLGNQLGLRLPIEDFRFRGESVPIVEGMPADPRVAMYVLDVLTAHLDKFMALLDANNKQMFRQEMQIAQLIAREKHLMSQLDEAAKFTKRLVEEAEYYKSQNSHWIIKDDQGRYLRHADDQKLTHTSQLDLRGDEYTALQFMSKTGAVTWANRLMGTRRFRNYNLIVYRVSIVREV